MSFIGKVAAVFTASTGGLTTGVNQAARSMGRLERSVASLRSGMGALVAIQGAQLFGSIATAAGNYVGSLVRMGQAQAEAIDQQSKLAARVGMTYGEFAGLSLAGDLAGVGMDSVAKAATKADIAFVKASRGSATARAAFDAIGLSVDELSGMSSAERFSAITQAIAELPTEAERAAAATALFGKAGAELLPMFAGGAAGIAQAAEQAERLGLALTTAQGQDVEAMNDSITLAGKAIEGVVNQIVAYLAPAVQAVADQFTTLVGEIGGANIGQAIGEALLEGARFLAGVGDWIVANFSGVFDYLGEVGSFWSGVMDAGNRLANLFLSAFKVFEFVGNTIGGMFSDIISYMLGGIAKVAEVIPGVAQFADDLRAGADYMSSQADGFLAAADANLSASAAAFGAAFAESAAAVAPAFEGPLTSALDSAVDRARQSAAQTEERGRGATPVQSPGNAGAAPTQALQGMDSRSQQGIAEMFRLMRGDGGDVQERQLSVLERIAENTAGGDETLAFDF